MTIPPGGQRPQPELPDFWNLIARKRLGISDERWRWMSLEAIGDDGERHTLLKGGMEGPPFKSGPRKGEVNWARRDRAWDRTLVISMDEYRAFRDEWEAKTGRCKNCGGCGWVGFRWSATEGVSFRRCARCEGTGAKP